MPRKITPLKTPVAFSILAQKAHTHQSVFDALPDSAFVREWQLVQSPKRQRSPVPLPFSSSTLKRMVAACTFPKPVKLSERVSAFNVGAVRAWMAAHIMVEGSVVTTTTPQEKAAARLPTGASQPHGYSALAHADDAAILNRLPTKKTPRKALVTPEARAAPDVCRLVLNAAPDTPPCALFVAEPCAPPHPRQPPNKAADLPAQLGENHA